jgi:hypothetical protein
MDYINRDVNGLPFIEEVYKVVFVDLVSVEDGVVCGLRDDNDPWGLFSLRVRLGLDSGPSGIGSSSTVNGLVNVDGVVLGCIYDPSFSVSRPSRYRVVDPGRLVDYGGIMYESLLGHVSGGVRHTVMFINELGCGK